jgi:hypothetical protein
MSRIQNGCTPEQTANPSSTHVSAIDVSSNTRPTQEELRSIYYSPSADSRSKRSEAHDEDDSNEISIHQWSESSSSASASSTSVFSSSLLSSSVVSSFDQPPQTPVSEARSKQNLTHGSSVQHSASSLVSSSETIESEHHQHRVQQQKLHSQFKSTSLPHVIPSPLPVSSSSSSSSTLPASESMTSRLDFNTVASLQSAFEAQANQEFSHRVLEQHHDNQGKEEEDGAALPSISTVMMLPSDAALSLVHGHSSSTTSSSSLPSSPSASTSLEAQSGFFNLCAPTSHAQGVDTTGSSSALLDDSFSIMLNASSSALPRDLHGMPTQAASSSSSSSAEFGSASSMTEEEDAKMRILMMAVSAPVPSIQ